MSDAKDVHDERQGYFDMTYVPWLVYVGILTMLSVAERMATPEAEGADRLIDSIINWFALLGLVGTAIWTVVAAWAHHRTMKTWRLWARLILGGFLGPLVAVIAVSLIAHDVDGTFWMLSSPVLGMLAVSLAMAVSTIVVAVFTRSS